MIAYWGTRALIPAQPADIPRLEEVGLKGAVVLFTLGVSLVTGVGFGLLPALQATGRRLQARPARGGPGCSSRPRRASRQSRARGGRNGDLRSCC